MSETISPENTSENDAEPSQSNPQEQQIANHATITTNSTRQNYELNFDFLIVDQDLSSPTSSISVSDSATIKAKKTARIWRFFSKKKSSAGKNLTTPVRPPLSVDIDQLSIEETTTTCLCGNLGRFSCSGKGHRQMMGEGVSETPKHTKLSSSGGALKDDRSSPASRISGQDNQSPTTTLASLFRFPQTLTLASSVIQFPSDQSLPHGLMSTMREDSNDPEFPLPHRALCCSTGTSSADSLTSSIATTSDMEGDLATPRGARVATVVCPASSVVADIESRLIRRSGISFVICPYRAESDTVSTGDDMVGSSAVVVPPSSTGTGESSPAIVELPSRMPRTIHTQIDYVHCLVPDLQRIASCAYYWGVMDRYEAERLLDTRPEGTFLLRDSAQDEFLFSVSFRRYSRSLHARVEQWNHQFSFDSHDPSVFSSPSVCELIEHYKDPASCMFFEPMLTVPLARTFPFSLQALCRTAICAATTYDGISFLPIPKSLRQYLQYYHYKQKVRVRRFEANGLSGTPGGASTRRLRPEPIHDFLPPPIPFPPTSADAGEATARQSRSGDMA